MCTEKDIFKQIENWFSSKLQKCIVKKCRCIYGGELNNRENGDETVSFYVYLYVGIDDSEIDTMFLNCVEHVYYEWISKQFSLAIKSKAILDRKISNKKYQKEIIRSLGQQSSEEFRKYLLNIYGIDIDIITSVSSLYYEKNLCSTAVVFAIPNIHDISSLQGITFDDSISFNVKNSNFAHRF